jgi:F-type H+-transporting ATPase subunit epsilon
MHVIIAKVNENLFDGEAASMTLPGAEGQLTVLPEHMPLITTLKEGVITVRPGGDEPEQTFPIVGGVLEVRQDGATVIL